MNLSRAWPLIREVGKEYSNDAIPRLAASLAYYTVISLAPMLVLTVMILGVVYGEEAAQGKVEEQASGMVGPQPAAAISDMIHAAGQQGASGIAIAISVVILLFGASGVFIELQSSMNTIFDVEQRKSGGWMALVKDRLISLSMVFGVAFLLLVSLAISTVLSVVVGKLAGGWAAMSMAIDILVSLIVITTLFSAIFKFLPDVELRWRDTVIGAVTTAVLFIVGKYGLSWYLGRGSTASAYGAAGSFAALLIWIYYSSQILFVGAEFTQVYANRFGSRVRVQGAKAQPRLGEAPGSPVEPSRAGSLRRGSLSLQAGGRRHGDAPVHSPPGARATHRSTTAHVYEVPGDSTATEKVGALATGAMIGGAAALLGLFLKHRLSRTAQGAGGIDQRLDHIEGRIGSLKRLRTASVEQRVADRLQRIEERILTDAKAARRVETMSLKDRLAALVRQGAAAAAAHGK